MKEGLKNDWLVILAAVAVGAAITVFVLIVLAQPDTVLDCLLDGQEAGVDAGTLIDFCSRLGD